MKSASHLHRKYNMYRWNIITIAIFYALPVVQLVFTYQQVSLFDQGQWSNSRFTFFGNPEKRLELKPEFFSWQTVELSGFSQ